jgi:hypothetical protein
LLADGEQNKLEAIIEASEAEVMTEDGLGTDTIRFDEIDKEGG